MPKVSKGSKYTKRYTEKDLEKALKAIKKGMSKKIAAKKFNVPRATLQFRLSNAFVKNRPGPDTVLSSVEENEIVDWVITLSRRGFPRRKEDIIKSVKVFLDEIPRPNSFIDNTPGDGWYKLFLKRHPRLSIKTSGIVPSASLRVTETQIKKWFKQIEEYLKETDYIHILNDPSRVYNGDETNFILCPKNSSNIVAIAGTKNINDHTQSKSCVTVMFTFGADGEQTPPMITFPVNEMQSEDRKSVPEEWGINFSEKGWMNAQIFSEYIKHILHPALRKRNITFPVILFLDGFKSHITYQLFQFCESLEIILIALYPNATRILQPFEVATFRPIKGVWNKSLLDEKTGKLTQTVLKTDVAPILKKLLPTIDKTTLKNGFSACGLHPFDPQKVNYAKCSIPSTLGPEYYDDDCSASLDYQTFQDLVGPQLMKKMKNHVVGTSVEAKKLFELYMYLAPSPSSLTIKNKHKHIKDTSEDEYNVGESIIESTTNLARDNILPLETEASDPIHYDEYFDETTDMNCSEVDIDKQYCESSPASIVPKAAQTVGTISKYPRENSSCKMNASRQSFASIDEKCVEKGKMAIEISSKNSLTKSNDSKTHRSFVLISTCWDTDDQENNKKTLKEIQPKLNKRKLRNSSRLKSKK